jgi:hypothetical protein
MHQTAERVENFAIFLSDTKNKQYGFLSSSKRYKKWQKCILSLVYRYKKSLFSILSLDKRHTEKGFGDHCLIPYLSVMICS